MLSLIDMTFDWKMRSTPWGARLCKAAHRSAGSFRGIRALQRHLSCTRTQPTDAHQVVGRAGERDQLGIAPHATQARLAQSADALAPAPELFDALTHDL